MELLSAPLTETMKEFVHAQATAGGFADAGAYVSALIQQEQARAKIETLLLEGLQTPVSAMTRADWDELKHNVMKREANRLPT